MVIEIRDGKAGKVCTLCCLWKPLSEYHRQRRAGIQVGNGYKSACKACLNAQRRQKRTNRSNLERAKQRAYVAANVTHIQLLKSTHRKQHAEQYAAAQARYLEQHRTEVNARARSRRQANLDHFREIGRRSRERHQQERNAYQRTYTKRNRDKAAAALNRRRAKLHGAHGSHTLQQWQLLKEKYHHTCLCCGQQEPQITLTRDHIVPLQCGGGDSIDNIQPLCAPCNSRKGTRTMDYRKG